MNIDVKAQLQTGRWLAIAMTTLVLFLSVPVFGAKEKASVPDLTQGGKLAGNHDWNLGPTGLRGAMWAWSMVTTDARQILVTKVDKGSPADGIVQVNDVILGVGGAKFSSDARVAFGNAITAAETQAAGGKLQLLLWRKGKEFAVTVPLRVMGSYAKQWPFGGCEKSMKIVELGAAALPARSAVTVARIDVRAVIPPSDAAATLRYADDLVSAQKETVKHPAPRPQPTACPRGQREIKFPISSTTDSLDRTPPGPPGELAVRDQSLRWSPAAGDVFWYRIYRGEKPYFSPGAATLLTYVEKSTTGFEDSAAGFDGRPLQGVRYYRVSAVDAAGNEGSATAAVGVEFPSRERTKD